MAIRDPLEPRRQEALAALLRRARRIAAARGLAPTTAKAYLQWIRRFARAHGPDACLCDETVSRFLRDLEGSASASTLNQARCALLFFARHVQPDGGTAVPIPEQISTSSRAAV